MKCRWPNKFFFLHSIGWEGDADFFHQTVVNESLCTWVKWSTQLKLIPAFIRWSNEEYYYFPPLDGMWVLYKATPPPITKLIKKDYSKKFNTFEKNPTVNWIGPSFPSKQDCRTRMGRRGLPFRDLLCIHISLKTRYMFLKTFSFLWLGLFSLC